MAATRAAQRWEALRELFGMIGAFTTSTGHTPQLFTVLLQLRKHKQFESDLKAPMGTSCDHAGMASLVLLTGTNLYILT